ncbi:MAG: DUF2179 domain-containing protein [Chloroflexi bacterium]|nr:DUF2179 domain-containing protein [Chloroflexota bacterium]MBU1660175.1 DUF2179 domain-containing protein [Chloroflexota bacterium]
MENIFTLQALTGAAIIFGLRVIEMTVGTLRALYVMRGRKALVWILGFLQSGIFVAAISSVVTNLDNPLNYIGYAAGFATGSVVGMWIEARLAVGHIHLSIISPRRGAAIAESLRDEGYAVTEVPARGKDGMVTMLSCSVRRRNVPRVDKLVRTVDESAFITAEEVRPVRRGFWRA